MSTTRRKKDSISSFTPAAILRSMFLKYDLDYDGYLSTSEIVMLLQTDIGFDKDQSEACAYLLDAKGKGSISFDHFNDWIKTGDRIRNILDVSKFSLLKAAMDMFRTYDVNDNHVIDKGEFKKLFLDLGGDMKNIKSAYRKLDLDRDKKITFSEFLYWLKWVSYEDFLLPIATT